MIMSSELQQQAPPPGNQATTFHPMFLAHLVVPGLSVPSDAVFLAWWKIGPQSSEPAQYLVLVLAASWPATAGLSLARALNRKALGCALSL